MDMALVVRRLTHPRVTTTAQFLWVLRNFPFTGGGSTQDFKDFLDVAISVCEGGHAAAKQQALAKLQTIALANRGRVARGFPKLDPDAILYELTLRVLEPRLVDQGGYGLCGPAAFVVLLAKTSPVQYINLALELLLTGASIFRGMKIRPNDSIRMHRPEVRTPHADWLVLASVRSSDDAIYQDMDRGRYGGTSSALMIDWLKRAGYGVVVGAFAAHLTGTIKKLSSLPLIKQLDAWACCTFHPQRPNFLNGIDLTHITDQSFNLFLADRFCRNHWKVFLMVSEKYTQTSGNEDPIEKALAPMRAIGAPNLDGMRQNLVGQLVGTGTNHWVLAKEIHLAGDGTVRITRYSWGKKDITAPISRELFYTIYGGFVAVTTMSVQDAIANWHW